MTISCKCGNTFDFDTKEGQVTGFEFMHGESKKVGEYIGIHCLECDECVIMSEPEEVNDDE